MGTISAEVTSAICSADTYGAFALHDERQNIKEITTVNNSTVFVLFKVKTSSFMKQ